MATDLDDKDIQISAEKVPIVMEKSHHFEWQVLEQQTIVYFLLSFVQVPT
jgi:desulfoferrodoxin (superoxide reductase-like protein)